MKPGPDDGGRKVAVWPRDETEGTEQEKIGVIALGCCKPPL